MLILDSRGIRLNNQNLWGKKVTRHLNYSDNPSLSLSFSLSLSLSFFLSLSLSLSLFLSLSLSLTFFFSLMNYLNTHRRAFYCFKTRCISSRCHVVCSFIHVYIHTLCVSLRVCACVRVCARVQTNF